MEYVIELFCYKIIVSVPLVSPCCLFKALHHPFSSSYIAASLSATTSDVLEDFVEEVL